jgi:hypothetical protein
MLSKRGLGGVRLLVVLSRTTLSPNATNRRVIVRPVRGDAKPILIVYCGAGSKVYVVVANIISGVIKHKLRAEMQGAIPGENN